LLLDTNAVSAAMAGRDELDRYLGRMKPEVRLLTSVIVEGEIRFGLARVPPGKRKRRLTNALEKVLEALYEILPTTRDVASRYATLKADLWGAGTPIDENDLWIAAAAVTHGLVLLTSDTDFLGIPQLAVEDWSLG
jgi:predicted nucleic acid-binding protein